MGLFVGKKNKEKSKAGTESVLTAPMAGHCIPVTQVADPTFAGELLGKGVAILPENGRVTAPADGVVDMVFETGHALTMKTDGGAEVLLHVGIDTVQLKGKGFSSRVTAGQRVHPGDLLLEADLALIRRAGYDTSTVMVVCNPEAFREIECAADRDVAANETVMRLVP